MMGGGGRMGGVLTAADESAVVQLHGHPEAPELDGSRVLAAGQQHTVRLEVAVDDVVAVAVAQRLQHLTEVVTAQDNPHAQ